MKKTGKIQTNGTLPQYALPKIAIKKGGMFSDSIKISASSFGGANVTMGPSFFYSPELTPESWLLPKSRIEVLKWARIFYNLDPYVGSIIDMHAKYPFSPFYFSCADDVALQKYNELLLENGFDWYDWTLQASLSYWRFGEACVWGNWDTDKRTWASFICLDPDVLDVKQDPFSGKYTIELIPTLEIKKIVRDALVNKTATVPSSIIENVLNNKKIPLDAEGVPINNEEGLPYEPARVFIFARKTDPGATRGTPIIQRLFKCVTGDTRIALLDGTNPTIEELYNSRNENFWVYGVDKQGNIVPAKAERALYVHEEETLAVTLDNGEIIRCTKDHPFILRDGSKCEAQNLKPGTSLMPLYRKYQPMGKYGTKRATYEKVYNPGTNTWEWTHVKVALAENREQFKLKGSRRIHHVDFNSHNNTPENLKVISNEEHTSIHARYARTPERMKELADLVYKMVKMFGAAALGVAHKKSPTLNHKVISVSPTGKTEKVYAIGNAGENHNFMIALADGSGIASGNTLIYQDKIRLAQIAIADRHHLPIELWTVGHLSNDPQQSILPDEETLNNIREMINAATQTPPFSIVYSPLLKYEALGVSGKLLSVYEDLGYVENQLLVGLGVNKNLILGDGPSFSNAETVALHRLIMEYQTMRDLFTNWMKKNILMPVAIANNIVDSNGKYIIPEIKWTKSLQPKKDKDELDTYYKFWKDGLITTKTLFRKMPDDIKYNDEKRGLEEEIGTIFDKQDKRLPKQFKQQLPSGEISGGAPKITPPSSPFSLDKAPTTSPEMGNLPPKLESPEVSTTPTPEVPTTPPETPTT